MARQAIPTSIHFNVCTNIYSVTVINTHVKPLKMIFYCRPLNVFYIFEPVRYIERAVVRRRAVSSCITCSCQNNIFNDNFLSAINYIAQPPLRSMHAALCASKLTSSRCCYFFLFLSRHFRILRISARTLKY